MQKKKILVVEDSEPLRKVLVERLKEASFDVVEASGGEEGLKLAESEKPDMLITDVIMYPMDGLELAKRVRESGVWGEQLHIVALTNQNSNEEKARIDPLHLDAYLIKTDTPLVELVKKVKELFNEKKD